MLHARVQSTAALQQQHVDRLHRHTIHTTSAGMDHANGPTARATVTSTIAGGGDRSNEWC